MASSARRLSVLCLVFLSFHGSLAGSSVCRRWGLDSVLAGVRSQCPIWVERCSPEQVNGDELDRDLGCAQCNSYHSIFFYASWCPFSRKARPVFDALSSMFPQIRHLTVEESDTMPSVFARYGIRSIPSLIIANGTTRMQYHGAKDLDSLVKFYKATTGHGPVAYFAVEEEPAGIGSKAPLSPRDRSLQEIIRSEPYLSLSLLFFCLRAFACFFSVFLTRIRAFLVMHAPRANLGIFGEWKHLLERVLHVIDLRKLSSKLRLSNKAGNFQKGAKNARVWASSLASVSLGESSSRDS